MPVGECSPEADGHSSPRGHHAMTGDGRGESTRWIPAARSVALLRWSASWLSLAHLFLRLWSISNYHHDARQSSSSRINILPRVRGHALCSKYGSIVPDWLT